MTNPAKRIEGKEITIKIGMMVGESIEYVPMGYYTAEKPKTDESQITVTAYDRMMKTERAFRRWHCRDYRYSNCAECDIEDYRSNSCYRWTDCDINAASG